MGETEIDVETLKDILSRVLSDFTPRMGVKWDSIGIKLGQRNLVAQLRPLSELGGQKVQRIINEWLESDHKDVPVRAETILEALRSPSVKLGAVAKEFEKKFAEELRRRAEEQRVAQHSASHPSQEPPPPGATVSNLESGVSDGDGQPPPSNNSRPQPSASLGSGGLVVPEQVEDGRVDIPPLEKDGGVPVEGVGSPVEESEKERGQPPPGDAQRGSEHDGDVEHDGPIPADVLDATGRRTTDQTLCGVFGHFEARYAEAVQSQAYTSLQITKCTTIGLPRSGKTCLKHLLTGQEWDVKVGTPSTGVMEAPEWVECYTLDRDAERSMWQRFTREERVKSVLGSFTKGEYKDGSASKDSTEPDLQPSIPSEQGTGVTGLEATARSPRWQANSAVLQKAFEEMKLDEKLAHATDEQYKGVSLDKRRFLHFIDTGGQAIYHDVHPVLITSPSVYLVVVNVEKCLKEKNGADFLSTDLTQNALRSIHTFSTKAPKGMKHMKLYSRRPKVFIVGTHLDCIPPEEQEVRLSELHTALEEKMLNKPYHRFVRYDPKGRCFWAVDNTKAGMPADKVEPAYLKYVNNLRGQIQDRSMDMKVDVPLVWLLFEQLTHFSDASHFTYEELYQFAHNKDFVRDNTDFEMLVELFHILGLYYYKAPRKGEQRIVYTKPNSFYKTTSNLLLQVQQQLLAQTGGGDDSERMKGVINIHKAYEQLGAPVRSGSLPPADWFISLLADLRLIAQVQGSSYIVPAALPSQQVPFQTGTVDSLLVTFTPWVAYQVCYIPSGLYCALIADLITSKEWEPISLQRKQAIFKFSFGDVHIHEEISYIEICISVDPRRHDLQAATSLSHHCNHVREEIRDRLVFVWRRIYEDLLFSDVSENSSDCSKNMRWGFHCNSHRGESGKTHIAEYISSEDKTKYYALCLKPQSSLIQLVPKRQAVWFQDSQDPNDKLILYLCN